MYTGLARLYGTTQNIYTMSKTLDRGCINVIQMFCVTWDGTVHSKESLKSFEIAVGHSPGFGLPFVAILPQCTKAT